MSTSIKAYTTYTTGQLRQALKVTQYTWENKKDIVLDYLSNFCDYEVVKDGSKILYKVYELYCEYEPMPLVSEVIYRDYVEEIAAIVDRSPYTNETLIMDEIFQERNKYKHSYWSVNFYTKWALKNCFFFSDEEFWCREIDKWTYDTIPEDEEEELRERLRSNRVKATKRVMRVLIDSFGQLKKRDQEKEELRSWGWEID